MLLFTFCFIFYLYLEKIIWQSKQISIPMLYLDASVKEKRERFDNIYDLEALASLTLIWINLIQKSKVACSSCFVDLKKETFHLWVFCFRKLNSNYFTFNFFVLKRFARKIFDLTLKAWNTSLLTKKKETYKGYIFLFYTWNEESLVICLAMASSGCEWEESTKAIEEFESDAAAGIWVVDEFESK